MRRLSRSRGRPAGAGRLIAAAEPTVTSWTVRELLWVSMYDEVRDDERRRVIEEICPNAVASTKVVYEPDLMVDAGVS
jgi:hypothetical protein